MARKETLMFYPDADRLKAAEAKQFFLDIVKPRMSEEKAMSNDGDDTVLREPFSSETVAAVSSNIQHTILLSI